MSLTRTTPMKRRYRKRRDGRPMCVWAKCRRARYEGDLCAKHAADKLFSELIRERDGMCQNCGRVENGQCAHLISRRYTATRWSMRNALQLCMQCHVYYTHNPIAWDLWCEQLLGAASWRELRMLALNGEPEKPEAALARLRQMEAA